MLARLLKWPARPVEDAVIETMARVERRLTECKQP